MQTMPKGDDLMQTFIDDYIEQGMQKGMQQGEALSLLRLMQHKFGDIPEDARLRIASAEPETLARWFDQALTADNLDEVLH